MKEVILAQSGEATCRGEVAFRYEEGERAKVYRDHENGEIEILLVEGEGKGSLLTVGHDMITFV